MEARFEQLLRDVMRRLRNLERPAGRTVPVVSTLPAGSFDGQQVRFRHTAGVAPWLCVWDSALNSGAGAWAVTSGPPLRAVQSAGASGTSAAINTWTALPNTPTITIPVGGVYNIVAGGNLSSESAGAKQARVRGWDGATGSSVVGSMLASGVTQGSSAGNVAPVQMVLADGATLSLQMCTDNTTVTFGAAAELWRLAATPIELRP